MPSNITPSRVYVKVLTPFGFSREKFPQKFLGIGSHLVEGGITPIYGTAIREGTTPIPDSRPAMILPH